MVHPILFYARDTVFPDFPAEHDLQVLYRYLGTFLAQHIESTGNFVFDSVYLHGEVDELIREIYTGLQQLRCDRDDCLSFEMMRNAKR